MHNEKLYDRIKNLQKEDYFKFSYSAICKKLREMSFNLHPSGLSSYINRGGYPDIDKNEDLKEAIAELLLCEVLEIFPRGEKMAYVKCPECGLLIPTIQIPHFEGKIYHRPGCILEGKEELGDGVKIKIEKKF